MPPKLGSDLTVLLALCSDKDVVADDNNDDAGSLRESADKDEGLLSRFDELEE